MKTATFATSKNSGLWRAMECSRQNTPVKWCCRNFTGRAEDGELRRCSERATASSHAATYAAWLRRPGRPQGRRVERNKRQGNQCLRHQYPIRYSIHWVLPNSQLSVLRHWAFCPRPKHSTCFLARKFFNTRRIMSTLTLGHSF